MTCHCFLQPIRRDLPSSSYITHWPCHQYKLYVNESWISDGTGYVDDGREIFDDDLDEEPSDG